MNKENNSGNRIIFLVWKRYHFGERILTKPFNQFYTFLTLCRGEMEDYKHFFLPCHIFIFANIIIQNFTMTCWIVEF